MRPSRGISALHDVPSILCIVGCFLGFIALYGPFFKSTPVRLSKSARARRQHSSFIPIYNPGTIFPNVPNRISTLTVVPKPPRECISRIRVNSSTALDNSPDMRARAASSKSGGRSVRRSNPSRGNEVVQSVSCKSSVVSASALGKHGRAQDKKVGLYAHFCLIPVDSTGSC